VKLKIIVALVVFAIFMVALTGCGSTAKNQGKAEQKTEQKTDQKAEQKNDKLATIATHAVGTGYNAVSSGIAKLISDHTTIKATTVPMAGPNAFMPLLNKGEVSMGLAAVPDIAWGFAGKISYKEPNKNIRLLVNGGYTTMAGFVVKKDSHVKRVGDLKGKRVAYGYGGNQMAMQIITGELKVAGLTWDDVTKVPVTDVTKGIEAIAEGRADAAFGLGVTSPKVVEVDAAIGLRALNGGGVKPAEIGSAPQEVLEIMREYVPQIDYLYEKAGTGYLKEDATVWKFPMGLMASPNLSDEDAYEIVKTLWNNAQEMHSVHPWLKSWTNDRFFVENPPAPYHPGAIKFFKEQGVWSEVSEKAQQELLAQTK
jgi:TRAP transporter TAXI family solute receptor